MSDQQSRKDEMDAAELLFFSEIESSSAIPFTVDGINDCSYREMGRKYDRDSVYFELACYVFFRVDLLMFKRDQTFRDAVTPEMQQRFIKFFADVFAVSLADITDRFEERAAAYAALVRRGTDLQSLHFQLKQLMLESSSLDQPGRYKHDSAPVMIGDVFTDELDLQVVLLSWEKHIVASLIEWIESTVG